MPCCERSNVIVKENPLRVKGFVFSHRVATQEDVIGLSVVTSKFFPELKLLKRIFMIPFYDTTKDFNGNYLGHNEIRSTTQPTFTCSNSTIETLEKGVKYVQS